MEGQGGGGVRLVRMTRKAEIDTSAPFRSVKEAVLLFGDTLLAGELYASKLKQMNSFSSVKNDGVPLELGTVTAELEETKQNLEKAQEESLIMATCLSSLQDELEQTKKELQQLKEQEQQQQKSKRLTPPMIEEDEDLKSIEVSTKFELKPENNSKLAEFQKKRYVTFANPPSSVVARVLVPESDGAPSALLERQPSVKKKMKRKTMLIPLIGGIFSWKKSGNNGDQIASARA